MLPKSILDVSYQDIERLMEEEEKESEVLDYKVGLVSDDSLFKHVCAFANTRGGDLIFGIKESGGGGHPVAIMGVDNDKINREQIEDKILSNIEPRVHVAIKQIPIPDKPKSVLVIRVPSSKERPHCVKDRGYYKRFTFKSAPMTEREVAGLYKKRFYNHEQVNQYLEKILPEESSESIIGNIVVAPLNANQRMIDAVDHEKIRWFDTITLQSYDADWGLSIVPCKPVPSSYGLTDTKLTNYGQVGHCLSIHRNGCIHLRKEFHYRTKLPTYSLNARDLSLRLLETLEFACQTMRHYNYFEELMILVALSGPPNTVVSELEGKPYPDKLDAKIDRKFPFEYVEQNFTKVAECIMHEIVNCYGLPRCRYFDDFKS